MMDRFISDSLRDYWERRNEVEGAFWDVDFALFDSVLRWQEVSGIQGDLLEIGALFGRSAIVLGRHARVDENVHICDIFEANVSDKANSLENDASYPDLTKRVFEANYASFVLRPPDVIQDLSSSLSQRLDPSSVRFAHVDGGHLYDIVEDDVRTAQIVGKPDSIVAFDDYRAIHTPGVAAAVWGAVHSEQLFPFAVSEQKLYGSWSQSVANTCFEELFAWAESIGPALPHGVQSIKNMPVLIVANPGSHSFRARAARFLPPVVADRLRPPSRPAHLGI